MQENKRQEVGVHEAGHTVVPIYMRRQIKIWSPHLFVCLLQSQSRLAARLA